MRIVLLTPLYPPDTAESGLYIKELARRLSAIHQVTVIAYAHMPEAIEGVRIVSVSKRQPLLSRLLALTGMLMQEAKEADVIYAENGASVELPLAFATLFTGTPAILHRSDARAYEKARADARYGLVDRLAAFSVRQIFKHSPNARPEINPLLPRPEALLSAYEASWKEHLEGLETVLTPYEAR